MMVSLVGSTLSMSDFQFFAFIVEILIVLTRNLNYFTSLWEPKKVKRLSDSMDRS